MKTGAVFTALFMLSLPLYASGEDTFHDRGYGEKDIIFDNTCGDENSQEDFRKGVALLHSFFYGAAGEMFESLIEKNGVEGCPVAVWGAALSKVHFLWEPTSEEDMSTMRERLLVADEVAHKSTHITQIEKDYIKAGLEFFRENPQSYYERVAGYYDAFKALFEKYDNDVETSNFFGLMEVVKAATDGGEDMLQKMKKAGKRLEVILADRPTHVAALHYLMHAYDFPDLAELARNYAAQYARVAPDVPHALHMSSHIFTILGQWKESIATNKRAAYYADRFVEDKLGLDSKKVWHEERLHALKFIVVAQLQLGAVKSVEEIVEKSYRITGTVGGETAAHGLESLPSRLYVETRNWRMAADYEAPFYNLPLWKGVEYAPIFRLYVRVMAHVMLREMNKADERMAELQEKYDEVKRGAYLDPRPAYFVEWFDSMYLVADAYHKAGHGRVDDAMDVMQKVLEGYNPNTPEVTTTDLVPRFEQYGDLLVFLGRDEDAMVMYEKQEKISPRRFNLRFSLGSTAERLGRMSDAYHHYSALVELCEGHEVERDELRHAIDFIKSYDAAGSAAASAIVTLPAKVKIAPPSPQPTRNKGVLTAGVGLAGAAVALISAFIAFAAAGRRGRSNSRTTYAALV